MAKDRNELAEKLEIVGGIFEIDGMDEIMGKYKSGMNTIQFNAVTVQVAGLLLKGNRELADKVVALHRGETVEQIQEMGDTSYASALRDAIITDVMGFFASSQSSDGQKSPGPSTPTDR